MNERLTDYTADPQIVEENRIDALRQALRRAGVPWKEIHRLDDIRYVVGPEVQEGADCSNCNEHVLLALVDRLTAENAALLDLLLIRDSFPFAHPTQREYVTCRLCEEVGGQEDPLTHSPDCPLALVRQLSAGRGQ